MRNRFKNFPSLFALAIVPYVGCSQLGCAIDDTNDSLGEIADDVTSGPALKICAGTGTIGGNTVFTVQGVDFPTASHLRMLAENWSAQLLSWDDNDADYLGNTSFAIFAPRPQLARFRVIDFITNAEYIVAPPPALDGTCVHTNGYDDLTWVYPRTDTTGAAGGGLTKPPKVIRYQ